MEITPWAVLAAEQLKDRSYDTIYTGVVNGYRYDVCVITESLWVNIIWPQGHKLALRCSYSPGEPLNVASESPGKNAVTLKMQTVLGTYTVELSFFDGHSVPILHYTVTLQTHTDVSIPFWPKDVFIPDGVRDGENTGNVYMRQIGTRSGLVYAGFKEPLNGSFLYFQNLTAINSYAQATETSLGNTVSGEWPELGFGLPATQKKPLPGNQEFIVSDIYIAFSEQTPANQFDIAKIFLNLLAEVYKHLPRPETVYHDYPGILLKSEHDLETNKGCWSYRARHPYLNAYVSDYTSAPEIMVQLAVLLPLYDYEEWSGKKCKITKDLYDGLSAFYNKELGTIMRWLPAAEDLLDGSEEQKAPNVMDAWYLHHPLLNLSRMALMGDEMAKELFLKSTEYAIKVAQHFNYQWPVFYEMDTLEVVKAETQPGMGGEKDVAGIYAHVLMQAWQLTKEQRYLDEAEKAAQSLVQLGFDLFYQANDTAFSTGAMLRLYKETGKELYLDLSYLFIANLMKNVSLWNAEYGYSKNFPSFFALFPLNDAPYTAVYEEQEGFAAIHDFFANAEDVDILPSVNLLLAEFIKYTVSRVIYYYPPMLPQEMLADEAKSGEVDPNLWIALEDIHDGWEKSGSVGQEVYGAGLAFGIVPRHFIKVPDQAFYVFIDYPTAQLSVQHNSVTFKVLGHAELQCNLRMVKNGEDALPQFKVTAQNEEQQAVATESDYIAYQIKGNQQIAITWS